MTKNDIFNSAHRDAISERTQRFVDCAKAFNIASEALIGTVRELNGSTESLQKDFYMSMDKIAELIMKYISDEIKSSIFEVKGARIVKNLPNSVKKRLSR